MMSLQYFAFLCIFDDFLNLWGCFFCGKLTKHCRHAGTFQLVSQQSLASINNKNTTISTKRPPVAITVPQAFSAILGALVYRVYLRIFDRLLAPFCGICTNVVSINKMIKFTQTTKCSDLVMNEPACMHGLKLFIA